jgi:hypothetical protein
MLEYSLFDLCGLPMMNSPEGGIITNSADGVGFTKRNLLGQSEGKDGLGECGKVKGWFNGFNLIIDFWLSLKR